MFKTFLVDYNYEGRAWVLKIQARSEADAMHRLQRAAMYGIVAGELMLEIPAGIGGWLPRFVVWWNNVTGRS